MSRKLNKLSYLYDLLSKLFFAIQDSALNPDLLILSQTKLCIPSAADERSILYGCTL